MNEFCFEAFQRLHLWSERQKSQACSVCHYKEELETFSKCALGGKGSMWIHEHVEHRCLLLYVLNWNKVVSSEM